MKQLAERPAVTGADFDYPEHDPEWITAGSARVCGVCGMVSFGAEPAALPAGVVLGRAPGQPVLDADAEEFYRMEQWS